MQNIPFNIIAFNLFDRCANTGLGDVVSELLSALLNRLTELEQHEKELRACQSLVDEVCINNVTFLVFLLQINVVL